MIIASLPTIPQRKAALLQVIRSILHEQTQPVDRLHIWLNGYQQIDADLPQSEQITYHLEPSNPGPWVRYCAADDLADQDVFLTLDDDLFYPGDYVRRGIEELDRAGGAAVCFSAICWDPLAVRYVYGSQRWQCPVEAGLQRRWKGAILAGGTSFFRGKIIRSVTQPFLPGFETNDDMIVSLHLQRQHVPVYCCPKPAKWIREAEVSRAAHALFIRDTQARHEAFQRLVYQLGFDPTAGCLEDFLAQPKRILVQADICPPLAGSHDLEEQLTGLCEPGTGVHLVSPVPNSQARMVQQYLDRPFLIHAVNVPEPGGRMDWFPPVRAWRNGRVKREHNLRLGEIQRNARRRIKPTAIYQYQDGRLKEAGV